MTTGRYNYIAAIASVILLLIAMSACSKKTVPVQSEFRSEAVGPGMVSGGISPDDARWQELGLYSEPERREFQERAQAFENQDIYFDFDAYVLTAEAKGILNNKAEFLKRYPKTKVTIEGHCDERGTTEYNLALGERRANSAYQYLSNLGIDSQRMTTISYGEERPLSVGQSEDALARNRRDHFVVNF
jgi:peptidoglycan-associated lipoprotein